MMAQAPSAEVFSAVPEARRARLVERLNLLVEYQRTQQWSKQYDLLAALMKRAENRQDFINRTRQAYSKWGRTPLLAFTPYKVAQVEMSPGRAPWFISGCSQVLEEGRKVSKLAFVEAYWEKGDWFFSEVQNIGPGNEDDPCALLSGMPELKGYVNDTASVLDKETKEQLERVLASFKAEAGVDFTVVIVNSTGGMSAYDYSRALAERRWNGAGDKKADKLLVLIAIKDRRWHIQINRSLQEILTDEEVAELGVLMRAPFVEGRYGEGIRRCVEAFIKKITERRGASLKAGRQPFGPVRREGRNVRRLA